MASALSLTKTEMESFGRSLNLPRLPAIHQAITQKIIQARFCVNLRPRLFEIVFDAAELNLFVVHDHVAAAWIAIARLTDASDVNHHFLLVQRKSIADLLRRIKATVLCEHARDVGVALKAILMNEPKDTFDLPRVVNVFREHVLVERASWGTVDEHKGFGAVRARELGQKVPSFSGSLNRWIFQLLTCPEDCFFSTGAETIGIKQSSVVVVAQQGQLKIATVIDAFTRVGTIANHIAEAKNLIDLYPIDILENGTKRLKIAVDVADDGSSGHGRKSTNSKWLSVLKS